VEPCVGLRRHDALPAREPSHRCDRAFVWMRWRCRTEAIPIHLIMNLILHLLTIGWAFEARKRTVLNPHIGGR
jgi:hypothetical protein